MVGTNKKIFATVNIALIDTAIEMCFRCKFSKWKIHDTREREGRVETDQHL